MRSGSRPAWWWRAGLVAVLAMALGVAMALPRAGADVSGACDATIAGVDVRGRSASDPADAIPVREKDVVAVTMTAPAGVRSHEIRLEFAGIGWTVSDELDEGQTTAQDEVVVSDYADYGVGLYRVEGVATLGDGSTCTGAVLVDVQGNPLTTVAGLAATALAVGGAGAVAAATAKELRAARGRP